MYRILSLERSHLKGIDPVDPMNTLGGGDAYHAAYQTLYQAKPITCSVTGTTFDALPAPCAAILDVSLLFRSVTNN
jgi:sugar/nucleoside kinase (ribokinase family)